MHGGGAPQVRRKAAAERLADAIDPERALRARLTYADVGLLFDRRGQLRSVRELPDDLRTAITSIAVIHKRRSLQAYSDRGKPWDKTASLALLFTQLRSLLAKVEDAGPMTIRWLEPGSCP